MFENLKKIAFRIIVFVLNIALVGGAVSYFKSQQEKKQASDDLASNVSANQIQQQVATQAQQLQQIVEQNRKIKNDAIAQNSGTVTIQKPTTVTQTIPAVTKTVQVPVTTSSPKTTTKKS